jgi:hypothetical protein
MRSSVGLRWQSGRGVVWYDSRAMYGSEASWRMDFTVLTVRSANPLLYGNLGVLVM